ncbi:MAG: nuclear transport factor 2 family protein [Acidimicrobiaceae bacterium]|nr:nuclear transport factor 2 family protein [Acidimicrobiaceae bacterium]
MTDAARMIENLLYLYAERIDAGDLGGIADLFEHGRICAVPDAPPEAAFVGAEGVRKMYDAATRLYEDGTPKTHHITSNAIIEVDEELGTASSRSYYTVTQATPELPLQIIIAGRYHDTFQRLDDKWWFDTRIMFVDQMGDLSHHLLYSLD